MEERRVDILIYGWEKYFETQTQETRNKSFKEFLNKGLWQSSIKRIS